MSYTRNTSLVLLLFFALNTSSNSNNIYYQELQTFKQNGPKEVFNDDLDPRMQMLRNLNRYFYNYKQLDDKQVWRAPGFMFDLGIIVTQESMPQLYAYIADICTRETIEMPLVFVSTNPGFFNAVAAKLFTNIGGICIGQEMFELTQEETEAVVAHELGHIAYNHANKKLALLFMFYILLTYGPECIPEFMSSWPNSMFCSIICSQIVINKSFEKEADLFACQQGKAEGIKKLFSNWIEQSEQESIAFDQTLNEIKTSKDIVPSNVYYWAMLPLYYSSKLERAINTGIKWIYYNTPWGDHPSHEKRVKAAQKYIDAHAS